LFPTSKNSKLVDNVIVQLTELFVLLGRH
jgi:hypothetical protein